MNSTKDFTIMNGVLKRYKGSEKEVIVPEGVTKIDDEAFLGKKIKSVVLPDSLTDIGLCAFEYCEKLESIHLPKNLDCIGYAAFEGCTSLTSIVIPDSVTTLVNKCFCFCENLQTVVLPANLDYLGEDSFACCPQLKSFDMSEKAKKYQVIDGVLFTKNGKKLVLYPEGKENSHYFVPEKTEQIRAVSFKRTVNLKYVSFPSGLKSIGPKAFKESSLQYAVIPQNIIELSKDAFNKMEEYYETGDDIAAAFKVYNVPIPYIAVYASGFCELLKRPIYLGGPLDDLPAKTKNAAVNGFIYAIQNEITEIEQFRASYSDHIKRNIKTYLKKAENDEVLLLYMLEEQLPDKKQVQSLIKAISSKDRPDLTAELLDYLGDQIGYDMDEFDSLSDDNTNMKRMLQMAERREKIQNQKGIAGIVFVQSGEMDRFGHSNEYTGAKDMSDLKRYIEDLGGFLRNTVSSKTDYIICNYPNSQSVKMKKARELEIPVISEDEFLKMAKETQ